MDLQRGLRAMGVPTTILKSKPKELDALAMPVIAHMFPRRETRNSVGHFLVVLRVDDRSVQYIEPNYAASIETVPRTQFLRCWTGYLVAPTLKKTTAERFLELALWGTLLASIAIGGVPALRTIIARVGAAQPKWRLSFFASVAGVSLLTPGCTTLHPVVGTTPLTSSRPPGPSDGSRLVAWTTDVDLGALPADSVAEGVFQIENQGDAEERLHLGSPTCRCSQARLDRGLLRPGESTNVRMVMHSRPHQAGLAEAKVYIEADEGRWAELLSVHAVQLGAAFPDYSYVIDADAASKSTTVVGNLFLKSPAVIAKLEVVPASNESASGLVIRDKRIGPAVDAAGCVRRECSFTVTLGPSAGSVDQRQDVVLPVSVNIDGKKSEHRVRLAILPAKRAKAAKEVHASWP